MHALRCPYGETSSSVMPSIFGEHRDNKQHLANRTTINNRAPPGIAGSTLLEGPHQPGYQKLATLQGKQHSSGPLFPALFWCFETASPKTHSFCIKTDRASLRVTLRSPRRTTAVRCLSKLTGTPLPMESRSQEKVSGKRMSPAVGTNSLVSRHLVEPKKKLDVRRRLVGILEPCCPTGALSPCHRISARNRFLDAFHRAVGTFDILSRKAAFHCILLQMHVVSVRWPVF